MILRVAILLSVLASTAPAQAQRVIWEASAGAFRPAGDTELGAWGTGPGVGAGALYALSQGFGTAPALHIRARLVYTRMGLPEDPAIGSGGPRLPRERHFEGEAAHAFELSAGFEFIPSGPEADVAALFVMTGGLLQARPGHIDVESTFLSSTTRTRLSAARWISYGFVAPGVGTRVRIGDDESIVVEGRVAVTSRGRILGLPLSVAVRF